MEQKHPPRGQGPWCNASFLKQLQEGAQVFRFISVSDIERTVQECQDLDPDRNEYLVFRDVPHNAFLQLINTPHFYCRSLYIHNSNILRIKMAPRSHYTAIGKFTSVLGEKLTEMRVIREVGSEAAGLMDLGGLSKTPDGCWGPSPGDADYITCTLEVGKSELMQHLILDARLWLESLDSHVTQVILIDIAEDKPHIRIQKWEARERELRSTRSNRPQQATKTDEVHVSLVDNVPTADGRLRLSFAKIFERFPQPGTPEEEYIVFTEDDLTHIARRVWRRQNLIPREMARP